MMALGVLEATAHDPCSIRGVNTFLKESLLPLSSNDRMAILSLLYLYVVTPLSGINGKGKILNLIESKFAQFFNRCCRNTRIQISPCCT